MSAGQFADSALDRIALVHPLFELLGLLIEPPLATGSPRSNLSNNFWATLVIVPARI